MSRFPYNVLSPSSVARALNKISIHFINCDTIVCVEVVTYRRPMTLFPTVSLDLTLSFYEIIHLHYVDGEIGLCAGVSIVSVSISEDTYSYLRCGGDDAARVRDRGSATQLGGSWSCSDSALFIICLSVRK